MPAYQVPVCLNKDFHVFHHDRIVTFCRERKIGLHKGCAPQLDVGSPRTCKNAPRISNAKSLIRKSRFFYLLNTQECHGILIAVNGWFEL